MVGIGTVIGIIAVVAVAIFAYFGFYLIQDNQVGIKRRRMFGKAMPQGHIIAIDGEVGIQADTLMPGLYWKMPIVWKVEKVNVIYISPDSIGVVNAIDGAPMPKGRVLGDEVDSNNFQDAKLFLQNGGIKGPQVAILRPGVYRINTGAFNVTVAKATKIGEEMIGVVIAEDGRPLPSGYLIAPKPPEAASQECPYARTHKHFTDGQAFIDSGGYRGTQQESLQPGVYYINPLFFTVKPVNIQEVPPGYVAVIRSNIGVELESKQGAPSFNTGQDDITTPVHEESETLLISDKNVRGIWKDPVAPGKYNLNPLAFTPYLVPTSAITIDWANDLQKRHEPDSLNKKTDDFFKFSQLKVTSSDAFTLDVDVRMIIRIRPENAPFVIARFGSVENLIQQIVHPLIDSSFRNKAGNEKAIEFIKSRTRLQEEALNTARLEFDKYHVEAQNLLVSYILAPPELMKTQTDKEIAEQQLAQFQKQAEAQEMRKDVMSKTAQADKQGEVVAAQLSIEIERSRANARRESAEGDKASAMIIAEGESYKLQKMAEGEAAKIKSIAEAEAAKIEMTGKADGAKIKYIGEADAMKVKYMGDAEASRIKAVGQAEAYSEKSVGEGLADAFKAQVEAMGGDNIARLKIVEAIAAGKVQIVPEILVSSNGPSGGGSLGDVLTLLFTQKVAEEAKKAEAAKKPETIDIKSAELPVKKPEEAETF
ncbi:SPFH domain-containing protein [Methanomassiliicoccus luminyensis]|uniref:SPFH domain-containing protein n=2 Tax=Methanomassiliicoccus luminyensis TaxID=1080712 RepID=UPI0009D97F73|nr:SPFH domain-containing protein [Methanomassiliicoccus luminyensis]